MEAVRDTYPRLPPPLLERRDCGKACYHTEAAAKRSIRSLDHHKHANRWKGKLRPYLCRPCRAWHVGHSEYD